MDSYLEANAPRYLWNNKLLSLWIAVMLFMYCECIQSVKIPTTLYWASIQKPHVTITEHEYFFLLVCAPSVSLDFSPNYIDVVGTALRIANVTVVNGVAEFPGLRGNKISILKLANAPLGDKLAVKLKFRPDGTSGGREVGDHKKNTSLLLI